MTKEFQLVAAEDKYMLSSSGLRRSRPGIHPTEASVEYTLDGRKTVLGKCMRACWYRAMKIQKSESASAGLMQKANSGNWNEDGLIMRWKEMGIWIDNSIKFYNPNYYLSGEMDAVIRNPLNKKKIGVEVKSYYGYNANKIVTGSKRPPVPGTPKTDQFLQALVYAWEYRDQLDEYRMFYIERGDGHRVEFRVGFEELPSGEHQAYWEQLPGDYWNYFEEGKVLQPYNVEDVYKRYKKLLIHIKNKDMPEREFSDNCDRDKVEWLYKNKLLGKTKYDKFVKNPAKNPICEWQCSYCFWKSQCKKDSIVGTKGKKDD
jgi:hypothetical protein